jgi:hypothetical protein
LMCNKSFIGASRTHFCFLCQNYRGYTVFLSPLIS